MIYRTLDHEDLEEHDVSQLDTVLYGAAPITPERLEEALDVFGDIFIQAYGQTEMPDVGMVLPKADHVIGERQIESCGKPAMMVDALIADPETNDEICPLPRGEAGELVMRSPYVMEGYHGKPEKTAETIVDGWLRTGDIARRDEAGYVYLLDRESDMIISGGMNVYTTEVEDVLAECPGVREVAVVGIPDDDWGEAVHAVIVGDECLEATEVISFADDRLADYKKPKSVEFIDEIPTTPYGKMDKKAVREPYWEESDREIN
jgi:fatty-acyl-CoA synthase/long-chain acyl-CoA synthetase